MVRDGADRIAFLLCLLFVGLGCLWVGELGIQNDEALFSAGIYPPFGDVPKLLGKPYPAMVMSYVGTLKSYLYVPVFRIWRPSAASTRVPAIILGAITIWLFYILARRTVGTRAALVGTALVATDPTFLLTTRYDWGPVVIQHLCLVGGVLAVVRFAESHGYKWLALGFFAFGLGMWDKALFAWSLVGLAAAVLVVFPRRAFGAISAKSVGIAVAGFFLGSFPLIGYNATHDWVTFRSNAAWSSNELAYKAKLLLSTLEGNSMFGTLPREDWERPIRQPDDGLKRAWARANSFFGEPKKNWQGYLLIISLIVIPFVWRTSARTAFFFVLVYVAVTWTQMAFLKNGGTGTHHPVLMWPMPHLAIAAILAHASEKLRRGRVALGAAVLLVCFSNVLVTSTYYTKILRNGGSVAWSDAIFPASQALPFLRPSQVCVTDWGFFENIRLLHRGRIPMCVAVDPEAAPEILKRQIADPNAVFMGHVKGVEFNADSNSKLLHFAASQGYSMSFHRIFSDYNGRPIIEVFKLFKP
jgi:hypothetical protein